jgi:ABC-type antimicrobial peptide transport system permease subunit
VRANGGILRLILRQRFGLAGGGVVVGLALTALAGPILASHLVGVEATDALTVGATVTILMVAAMGAIYRPARRAASLDPLRALRHE